MYFQKIFAAVCLAGVANAASLGKNVATPDTCNNRGLEWAKYPNTKWDGTNNANADATYSSFDPAIIKNRAPSYNSTTTTIGGIKFWQDDLIYNSNEQANTLYYILNHRGFLYTPEAGVYTIDLGTADDVACFWINGYTMSGWTKSNAQKCVTGGSSDPTTFTINLPAGKFWPIRFIYGQAQGSANFNPKITSPSGVVLIDANGSNGNIVLRDCNGKTPTWPAFGSE